MLGHTKIESTVCYLGIEVEDALAIAELIGFELPGGADNLRPTDFSALSHFVAGFAVNRLILPALRIVSSDS